MVPIYHMFVFAISPKEDAFSGKLWPDHPTLHNFEIVFRQQHYFLRDFWIQFWNSTVIAASVGALTLFIATAAAFSISRLRVPGGRIVMNLALFTYFIPAAFLAVPMYRTMGNYGLLNNQLGADSGDGDHRLALRDLGAEAGLRQAADRARRSRASWTARPPCSSSGWSTSR